MPFIGGLIAFVILCILVYHGLSQAPVWLFFVPVIIIGLFVFFLVGVPAIRKQRILYASPLDGPMKVDLRTEQVGSKHRLHINVTMSQKDQLALEASGLLQNILFHYPNPKDPKEHFAYCNASLLYVHYVDFPNIAWRDQSKEDLLEGLHALRSRLDQQRQEQHQPLTEKKESFEI